MRIVVKLGAPLSQAVGENKLIVEMPEGATVADLLDDLRRRYPDFEAGLRGKGLRPPLDQTLYTLLLNARSLPLARAADTPLRDGDRLSLFLPVAGG